MEIKKLFQTKNMSYNTFFNTFPNIYPFTFDRLVNRNESKHRDKTKSLTRITRDTRKIKFLNKKLCKIFSCIPTPGQMKKTKNKKKRRKRISLRRKFEILCIHGRISRENRIKEKGKSIYE